MADTFFEAMIAILLVVISFHLTREGARRFGFAFLGWKFILLGFYFLALSALADFGDNFDTYTKYTSVNLIALGPVFENLLFLAGLCAILLGLFSSASTFQTIADEIVGRVQAETDLKSQEAFFRQIFDHAPLWLSVKSRAGRYEFVNERYASRLKRRTDEIIGKNRRDVHPVEVANLSSELDQKVFETGEAFREERDFHDESGNFLRSRLYLKFPIFDEAGEIKSVGSATMDTTEARRAAKQLSETEERFRGFAEIGSDFLWILDSEFRFTFSSNETKGENTLVGVIGRTPWDSHEDESNDDPDWIRYKSILEQRAPFEDFQFSREDAEGRTRYFNVRAQPIFEDDRFKGYIGTTRDITGLRQAEQLLSDAVQELPVSFMLFDAEERLVTWNDKSKEIFDWRDDILVPGKRFEDMLQIGVDDKVLVHDYQDKDEYIRARLAQFRAPSGPIENHRPDGTVIVTYEHKTPDGGTVSIRTDVTDLRRAQQAVLDNEKKFREILDNSPMAIAIVRGGVEGRLYFNDAFERVFVGDTDQPLGDIRESWVRPEIREELVERLRTEQPIIGPVVAERRRVDGTTFWCHLTYQRIEEFEGGPAYIGWHIDISDRMQAEQSANAANAQLNAFLEYAPCSIRMRDLEGRYVLANRQFIENRGLSADQVIGQLMKDSVTEAELERAHEHDAEILRTGRPINYQLEGRGRLSGRHYSATSFPVKAEDGELIGIGGIVLETTDQIFAQQEAAKANQRLQAFMDNAPCSITMRDSNGRILLANTSFSQRAKLAPQAAVGKHTFELFEDSTAAEFDNLMKSAAASQSAVTGVITNSAGEQDVFVEVTVFPIADDGERTTTFGHIGFDVTDRVRVEMELETRDRELRRIVEAVDSTNEGVIIQDENRRLIYANAAAWAHRQIDDAKIAVGQDMLPLMAQTDPQHAEVITGTIGPALTNDGHWSGETYFHRGSPLERICQYRANRLPDGDTIIITSDITEQKLAADALAEVNQQFQSVIRNAGVGVALRDLTGRYLIANEYYLRIFDLRESDVIGRTGDEIFKGILGDRVVERDADILREQESRTFELDDVTRSDGERRNVLITKFPISGPDGRPRGTGSVVQDVTDLRRQDAIMRSIMDSLPAYIVLVGAAGQIVYANSLLRNAAGIPAEENSRRRTEAVFADIEQFPTHEIAGKVFATGEPVENMELHIPLLDRTVLTNFVPIRGVRNQVSEVLICGIDITDRKASEAQLIQAGKLATLGETAAGMVHELSQPLNIIRLAAEGTLLRLSRGRDDQDYQKQQFERIDQQATRMSEIIEHIRIFCRKDSSDFELFDPIDSIDQSIDLISRQLATSGTKLTVALAEEKVHVNGRPVQLEQVILNLLSNARDAVESQKSSENNAAYEGEISIAAEIRDDREVVIRISDNGGGIPEESLAQLFEPFYTTKEPGQGTGLGLSISYGIILNMNGEITARNETDGAVFEIRLPCEPQSSAQEHKETAHDRLEENGTNGFEARLLIVDDEIEALNSIADLLREHKYRVMTAANGREALEYFRMEPPDLIITDLRMPEMDGRALIAEIRKHDKDLPIIVMTGDLGETETLENEMNSPNFRLLRKPISLTELLERITGLLENQS